MIRLMRRMALSAKALFFARCSRFVQDQVHRQSQAAATLQQDASDLYFSRLPMNA